MGADSRGGKEVRRVTFWLWRGSRGIFFLMIILLYGIQYVYSYGKSGNNMLLYNLRLGIDINVSLNNS
jgi:hypothetical protein